MYAVILSAVPGGESGKPTTSGGSFQSEYIKTNFWDTKLMISTSMPLVILCLCEDYPSLEK